jgi:PAS domain S-box-containing protein
VHRASLLPSLKDITTRTRWYVYVRWYLLLAIALPGMLSLFIVDGWSYQLRRDVLLGAIAVSSNGIFYIFSRLVKSTKGYRRVAVGLIAFDIFLVSVLIFINGGIESRNPILYVMPILISAAIFGRRAIYKTTAAVVIVYDSLIIADYLNIIHSIGAFDPTLRSWFSYVVNTVAFFSAVLILIGLVVDFITRLLAEKEHQASENLLALKQAQAIAKFGSWEWDRKKDKVFWSEELCRIFGVYSPDGYIDYESYIKAIHPEDREMVHATINRALKNAKPFSFDHRIVRPNGSVRYIHGNGQPTVDSSGAVVKMLGTAQDVTEAILLDQARSDFVALASHQLRTPATGVKQYLGLLLEGYAGSLSDDQASFLRIAYESNDRQLSIVDDLLYVAQVDSGNLKLSSERIDLVELLQNIVKDHALKFENKKQVLVFEPTPKKMYVHADGRRLRMAIENILDNAHKYTPDRGRIKLGLTKIGKDVVVLIEDSGIGIAKKDISKIFKKFSRINNPSTRQSQGTGLGLYLTRRIIKLHGGRIVVDSVIGKGTKFKIYLPQSKT